MENKEKENKKENAGSQAEKLLLEKLSAAKKVLVGIGNEWAVKGSLNDQENEQVKGVYEALARLLYEKDYFVVTTATDGEIFAAHLDSSRIVAPCGNVHWKQCGAGCAGQLWKEDAPEICPVCGASLVENTIHAEHYLEEGYLPQWQVYQKWLASTVNQELVILELGEGFLTPTVIRWPFEKTVYFNRKAWMFRVNENFYQISAEIKDRASAVHENSVKWISELVPVSKLC